MRFRATTVLFGLHATVCAVHIPKDAGSPYASMDSGVALEEPLLYDIEVNHILCDLNGGITDNPSSLHQRPLPVSRDMVMNQRYYTIFKAAPLLDG